MDCLAATGQNINLIVGLAVGLIALATVGAVLSKRFGVKSKYLLTIAVISGGFVLSGSLANNSVLAASSSDECGAQTVLTKNNSNNPAKNVQKIWNVPFTANTDWNNFTHYTVSAQAGFEPYTLTASGGTGTITGHRNDGKHGNHRDFFIFNPAGNSKDGEVRALIDLVDISGNPVQTGLVLRATNLGSSDHQAGVIAWTNVWFSGVGTDLVGVWRGFETPGGVVYITAPPNGGSKVLKLPVTSLTADGTTATVKVAEAIDNNPYNSVVIISDVDPSVDGQHTITVQDAHTLTFSTTANGTWNNTGSVDLAINNKRWIAARVIGNQVDVKHWLPGNSEPAWNDPFNSIHYTMPATLDNGDPTPTSGKFGISAAHVSEGKYINISNLQFKSLDP